VRASPRRAGSFQTGRLGGRFLNGCDCLCGYAIDHDRHESDRWYRQPPDGEDRRSNTSRRSPVADDGASRTMSLIPTFSGTAPRAPLIELDVLAHTQGCSAPKTPLRPLRAARDRSAGGTQGASTWPGLPTSASGTKHAHSCNSCHKRRTTCALKGISNPNCDARRSPSSDHVWTCI